MSQAQTQRPDLQVEDGEQILESLLQGSITGTAGTVVEQLARAECDIQIATAKRFPRSIEKFRKQAMALATESAEVAAKCFYSLPRGKDDSGRAKTIEGPSIRMAEIIASCWGNMRIEARIVSIEEEQVVARATCHDLENNVATSMEARRRIVDKWGKRYGLDMIGVTCMAALSIARRNAIFGVVPMAYAEPILEAARACAVGDQKTLPTRRTKMLEAWAKMGVLAEQVYARLGVAGESEITIDHLEEMFGLFTAVKDNQIKLHDAFPSGDDAKPNSQKTAAQRLAEQRAETKKPEPEVKPDPKPAETPTVAPKTEDKPKAADKPSPWDA